MTNFPRTLVVLRVGTIGCSWLWLLIFLPRQSRHHKTRLGCRPNAGDAEWAERQSMRYRAPRGNDRLLLALAFDLPASPVQTPQNATWVQAKRRRRGVGRAAWMPREPPPAMDGGWRRARGASSECGNPTKSDPTRSRALLVTFGAFSKVTRCKSGTLSRRYRRNGYTPNPNPNPSPSPKPQ